jgi:hypothetical protein
LALARAFDNRLRMRRVFAPALGGALLGLGVAAAVVLTGDAATAKTSYDSAYGFERTWNAAFRMVRVDMGLKVNEKDEATGYLLFDYKSAESAKTTSGSMEFIRSREPDAPVRVVVQLPQMPRYHEQVLVDSLVRKMRVEYGEPPVAKKRDPSPPRDAGPDAVEATW